MGSLFEQTIAQHGGEVIRIDGDGATFIFSHSVGQENAGRRSVEAAIDLHNAVNNLTREAEIPDVTLRLHTGIHSGVVLLSPGNITLGKYMILGEATNISRRLCDLAAADQIIISEQTLGADANFFKTRRQRLINVRGSQQKLMVLDIVGRASVANRFDARVSRGVAPFCGRNRELSQLDQILDACQQGSERRVIIKGAAGIGKTRLLNEFVSRAAQNKFSTHRGYCEAYLGANPFQPIIQIIRSLLTNEFGMPSDAGIDTVDKFIRKINPDLCKPILQLLSLETSTVSNTPIGFSDVYRAFVKLLEAVNTDLPIVLCIDDWQWVDGGSERVIEAVLANSTRPCLFVLATREYDNITAIMTNSRVIELNAFTDEEAKSVIDTLVKAPGPFVVERIINQAGGNPLFIEELCHSESSGKDSTEIQDRGAWLDTLIYSRFMKLTEEEANLVRTASAIGHMIPSWLLEEITGIRPNDPILVALGVKDFIYTSEFSETLRFKHSITRDAIYNTVGLEQRQAIHNRIVEALHSRAELTGEEEEFEALSYHYRAAGNAVRAIQYSVRAGDRAIAASSLDRAQAFYKAALEQIELLGSKDSFTDQYSALLRKYGHACVVDPSWEQLPMFRQATHKAAATNDKRALAWSEYWLGFILYGLGEARRSINHFEAARQAAESAGDQKQTEQIFITLGQARAAACEYKPALTLLDSSIRNKPADGSGSRTRIGLSYSLSCKAFILADQGNFAESDECFDQAIEMLADDQGKEHEMKASVLGHRSASCIWRYRFDEAIEYAHEAAKIAERVRARYLFAMNRTLAAAAQWEIDQASGSLDEVIENTNWLVSAASQQYLSLNHGWLAKTLERTGNIPLAREYAARALLRARKGDRLGEAMAYRALARIANREHRETRARKYIEKAYAASKARNSAHELAKNQVCEAELFNSHNQHDKATELVNSATDIYQALGMTTSPDGLDFPLLTPNH